ncbi:MAG: hypothetical protein ACREV1_08580 [Gammaproteobacteria bacterium]
MRVLHPQGMGVHAKIAFVGVVLPEDPVGVPEIGVVRGSVGQGPVRDAEGIIRLPVLAPGDIAEEAVQVLAVDDLLAA